MSEENTLRRQVYDLARLLLQAGISEGMIAHAGNMTRSGIQARGLTKDKGKESPLLGFGFAVTRAAFQHGYMSEVLAILSGKEVNNSTVLTAVMLYPDIRVREIIKLQELEDVCGVGPLPRDMVIATMKTLRASQQ